MFGGLKPSKSSLDRLPKQLGQRWERERIEFEDVLRTQEPCAGGSGEHGGIAGRSDGADEKRWAAS